MGTENLIAWYSGAIAFGGIFAFVIISIFRRWAPTGSTREYWAALSLDIHGLLYGDEELFWRHYSNVIRRSFKYVVQQLLGIVLAFSPLVISFFVVGPWVFAQWDRGAPLIVVPAESATLVFSAGKAGPTAPADLILRNGFRLSLSPQPGSQVLCPPRSVGCVVLQGFGFLAHTVDHDLTGTSELIVVRTSHNDWNPLWPFLSDVEFLFFVSLSLGSLLFVARDSKKAAQVPSSHTIGLVDYVFTQLATRCAGWINRLGNWETRVYAKRLAEIQVTEPIFVAGLARSGTTILLEKLASVAGVATHRYRDFPFVMAPIFWNHFLRFFGSTRKPIERPHKDKIRITSDSPEAFEEPIWQFYFPYQHEIARLHRLGSETINDQFADFYRQHIEKILLLRKGSRYVSKGNYNLPRIEYISKIFPDARFLIPIRHPLTHVESLARQHKLFSKYAIDDPKIPDYLRAVGHYEFGPQRVPICLAPDGARDIVGAWEGGDDLLGYAMQWADVYEFVASMCDENTALRRSILIVRFEDLCAKPGEEIKKILDFTGLRDGVSAKQLAQGIEPSSRSHNMLPNEAEACWQAVRHVAVRYGYTKDAGELLHLPMIPAISEV